MWKRFVLLLLLAASACGGGGGGGPDEIPSSWNQFRRDGFRRATGAGALQFNHTDVRAVAIDSQPPLRPVSASPIIDLDGNVYIASEGGTLRAFLPDDLEPKWPAQTQCPACCPNGNSSECDVRLGRFVSTPVQHIFDDETTIIIADQYDVAARPPAVAARRSGRVYFFSIDEKTKDASPVCTACFEPDVSEFGAGARAEFVSSPTVTINSITGTVAKVLIGARVVTAAGDEAGKAYALNNDGTVRWQYPRRGQPAIAPVTASPALGFGSSSYFLDNRGVLFQFTDDGQLKRQQEFPGLVDPTQLWAPSPVTATSIYLAGQDGRIYALNYDGSLRWQQQVEGERFISSLAVGAQAPIHEETFTPTPTGATHTPTLTPPPESTPTPSLTPVRANSNIFAVAESGKIVILDSEHGETPGPTPAPLTDTEVPVTDISNSPVISSDGILVFGSNESRMYAFDTSTLRLPRLCQGGKEDGSPCVSRDECTTAAQCLKGKCEDGELNGDPCSDVSDCVPRCVSGFCNAGEQRDEPCQDVLDCVPRCVPAWPVALGTCAADGGRAPCAEPACAGRPCVAAAVRSSAAIADDGTLYVGSDDGFLYAIGTFDTPTPTPSLAPATVTRTPSPIP